MLRTERTLIASHQNWDLLEYDSGDIVLVIKAKTSLAGLLKSENYECLMQEFQPKITCVRSVNDARNKSKHFLLVCPRDIWPSLKCVDADLTIGTSSNEEVMISASDRPVCLPSLTRIGGNLSVEFENAYLPQLSSMSGDFTSYFASSDFPQLEVIEGAAFLYDSDIQLHRLLAVGGDLYTQEAAVWQRLDSLKFLGGQFRGRGQPLHPLVQLMGKRDALAAAAEYKNRLSRIQASIDAAASDLDEAPPSMGLSL